MCDKYELSRCVLNEHAKLRSLQKFMYEHPLFCAKTERILRIVFCTAISVLQHCKFIEGVLAFESFADSQSCKSNLDHMKNCQLLTGLMVR